MFLVLQNDNLRTILSSVFLQSFPNLGRPQSHLMERLQVSPERAEQIIDAGSIEKVIASYVKMLFLLSIRCLM